MKYKIKKMKDGEYTEILTQVLRAHPDSDNFGYLGGQIIAVTDDFEPTEEIQSARWLAFENGYGCSLIMIDNIGDMITCINTMN